MERAVSKVVLYALKHHPKLMLLNPQIRKRIALTNIEAGRIAKVTVCREFSTIIWARLPCNLAILVSPTPTSFLADQDCDQDCQAILQSWSPKSKLIIGEQVGQGGRQQDCKQACNLGLQKVN